MRTKLFLVQPGEHSSENRGDQPGELSSEIRDAKGGRLFQSARWILIFCLIMSEAAPGFSGVRVGVERAKGDAPIDGALQGEILDNDCLGLAAIYEATDGSSRTQNGGGLTSPVSAWYEGTVIPGYAHRNVTGNERPELPGRPAFQGIVENDSLALVTLFDATGGWQWDDYSNWLSGPVSTWFGVDVEGDRVVGLSLSHNGLAGEIPADLGNLDALRRLDLWGNDLIGSIPAELGKLNNIEDLVLGNNQLSGEIPAELGGLHLLEYLHLGFNEQLSGTIPAELGELTRLTALWLDNNQLSGEIPVALGRLDSMQSCNLAGNLLSGSIPRELGNWRHAKTLYLFHNDLNGSLPAEIGNMTDLERLDLSGNRLSGPIPTEWGGLTSLESLNLNNNQLEGPIPGDVGSLIALTTLDLSYNQITGPIPADLGKLTELRSLKLNGNRLSGRIPVELGDITALTWLDLRENELSGPIPAELGGCNDLFYLSLGDNRLNGGIPPELANAGELGHIILDNNQLSGSIPPELGNLRGLWSLVLSSNQLNGSIPPELGALTRLNKLHLSSNQLGEMVPLGVAEVGANTWGGCDLTNNLPSLCIPDTPEYRALTAGDSICYLPFDPECAGILSIDVVGLNAVWLESRVVLRWATLAEPFTIQFGVDRAVDEDNYEEIGQVSAKGSIVDGASYTFIDSAIPVAVDRWAYRVRSIDRDGAVRSSAVVEITLPPPSEFGIVGVYPSPVSSHSQMTFELPQPAHVRIGLYDVLGREVHLVADEMRGSGRHTVSIPAADLAAGTYLLRLVSEGRIDGRTILVAAR